MADKITPLGEGTKPLFTKRHYEILAKFFNDWRKNPQSMFLLDLCALFKDDNPRFDPDKFLTSCGIGGSGDPT